MDFLLWIGKVSISWLFFYGCYRFFFQNLTHLKWNRAYLTGSLVISLILPFIKAPQMVSEPLVTYTGALDGIIITPVESTSGDYSWLTILGLIYIAGVTYMGIKLIRNLWKLNQLWQDAVRVELGEENAALYLFPDDRVNSFSFLRRIGISQSDYQHHFDMILRHELVHVRQQHSLDILLIEVLKVFFWFHPVISYYKESLQELHEYLADREVDNRDIYAEYLVAYTLNCHHPVLVNHFYKSSLLKQRIKMMYKDQSPKWKRSLYVMTALLGVGIMAVVAACSEQDRNGKDPGIAPTEVYTAVEEVPEFPGGAKAMYQYLASQIRFPKEAIENNVSGRVFLQFVVRKDGSIGDVEIIKGIGYGCDAEAVRVVRSMPNWKPGKEKGVPVNVKYTLPVAFLQEDVSLEKQKKPAEVTIFSLPANEGEKPLFIVDGKELTIDTQVDQDAIERVDVLKGKAAIQKYGAKGNSGVVEITLKKQ